MIIRFEKQDDDFVIKIKDADSTIVDFDYIDFIERLYNSETVDDIEFPEDVTDDEKDELEEMISKINQTVEEAIVVE